MPSRRNLAVALLAVGTWILMARRRGDRRPLDQGRWDPVPRPKT